MSKTSLYYKVLGLLLLVAVFYVGFKLGGDKKEVNTNTTVVSAKIVGKTSTISISSKDIKETNFIGKMPVIVGSGVLADAARKYIDQTISDFRTQANTDVPDMRKQFGANSPTASYEIDVDAKYAKASKTESIIMSVYAYTGGANGNENFKVITASLASGKILSLADVVKKGERTVFTVFVQKQLFAWKPSGADVSPVFPEDVNALKFNSFSNWSFDDKNLIIYFAKYEVGPGVLGAFAFPIPLNTIETFLDPTYL